MWTKDITIYHKEGKEWLKYHLKASVRDTSVLNRNKNGVSNGDNALIRVFEDGYGTSWKCLKEDVIVDGLVEDEIQVAPLTELQKKYGKDNVYQVVSIDKYLLGEELDHVKIGAK